MTHLGLLAELVFDTAIGCALADVLMAMPHLVRLSVGRESDDWMAERALPYLRIYWAIAGWMVEWDQRFARRYEDLFRWNEAGLSPRDREYLAETLLMRDNLCKVYAVPESLNQ